MGGQRIGPAPPCAPYLHCFLPSFTSWESPGFNYWLGVNYRSAMGLPGARVPLVPAPSSPTPAQLWGFAVSLAAGASPDPTRRRPVAVSLPLPQQAADQGKYFCACIRVILAQPPPSTSGASPRPLSVPNPSPGSPWGQPQCHGGPCPADPRLGIATSGLFLAPQGARVGCCPVPKPGPPCVSPYPKAP